MAGNTTLGLRFSFLSVCIFCDFFFFLYNRFHTEDPTKLSDPPTVLLSTGKKQLSQVLNCGDGPGLLT